ncbi:zinc finger protein 143-like isoform X2 [Belonocnema kinseyi]|uniref:zinc finger protein 143-like isoform X2 n=1 Tax=Belonocnema kinseyi TaxID=2817044 RepID=UPI00143D7995|nr:zinc finger protein 143-like isoform X2 [Belonocnema kinseyi]
MICSYSSLKTMSAQNAKPPDNRRAKQGDFTLLQGLEEYPGDTLECFSVFVSEDSSSNAEVQQLVLDDQMLGTSLTAVTLPDGTQAFVAGNIQGNGHEMKNPVDDEPREALILKEGELIELQLDPMSFLQTQEADNAENTYPQVQVVNGTAYVLTNQLDQEECVWQLEDGKMIKKENFVINNKLIEPKIKSQHPCPREGCAKVYSTPHHLKVHERSHTGQKPYLCSYPQCLKNFSTGYSLKAHLRTHTGEKPYVCTFASCNKKFKTSGDLLKHGRTHTGERPFICPVDGCGRSFTTSNIRKVHLRTHTGERPYKCTEPECDKAFASATNYKNHLRIHSGEKPYVCSMENCGRRFTEYSSLYKHHLVHTQHRPFECKICFRRYRQSNTLVLHKRTAHSLIESEDGMDIYLDTTSELNASNQKNRKNSKKQSTFLLSKDGGLHFSDDSDNETQILLVGDPTQVAALQQLGMEESFGDSAIDTSLDSSLNSSLNIKIDEIGFGWN